MVSVFLFILPYEQPQIAGKFGEINQHHFVHHHNTDCRVADTEEHMQEWR